MKTARRLLVYLLSIALALPAPVLADDTEIFSASPSAGAVTPNVLIVLDNSTNWSAAFGGGTKFSAEIAALSSAIGGLNANVNVGLMMFGETGAGNASPVTAYVRFAVRNMTPSNKGALQNLINNLNINSDKSSNAPYGFASFEAWRDVCARCCTCWAG